MTTYIVTDKNIEEVLEKNSLLIFDFHASWCAPCKSFGPIFERVSDFFPNAFFGKINTETEQGLSLDFQIRSIPTLVILKEGHIIYSESGSIPEYLLKNIVEKAVQLDVRTLESDES